MTHARAPTQRPALENPRLRSCSVNLTPCYIVFEIVIVIIVVIIVIVLVIFIVMIVIVVVIIVVVIVKINK